ncbi:MAG: ABC transporter permease [Bacteroidia bacterium]|nr:ABC transporter permease [Bacteroidia bacterium]
MYSISFKTILRSLIKNKRYSFISIGGLAIGISVFMLIALWTNDELSFNKSYENYSSVAKIMRNEFGSSDGIFTSDIMTTGMGTMLKTSYGSHFSKIALVRANIEDRIITSGENKYTEKGYFLQPDGLDILSLHMLHGTRNGLKDINSMLLSRSLAKKLFGDAYPVGKLVKLDASSDMLVTGVYDDLPGNSEYAEARYFAPLDKYLEGWSHLNVWNNYNMYILVQLKPGSNFEQTSSVIKHAIHQYDPKSQTEFFLHPMSKWHLDSTFENGVLVMSNRFELLLLLGSIGLLVLLLACINYMNLSTARSEQYSKEIGIRKTLGSERYQLIEQLLSESMIATFIAFLIAICTTWAVLPWFNQVSGKELCVPWDNYWFWLMTIAFLFMVSLLTGSYPAIYLSSFKPLKALAGVNHKTSFGATTREVLVIFQFTISIALIIASVIIYKQVQYTKSRPVGYTTKGLISLYMNTPDYRGKYLTLRDELKKTGLVQEIAVVNNPILSTKGWSPDYNWRGKNKDFNPSFLTMKVSYEYGKTIGLQFVNGRDFSRDLQSDQSGILINESTQHLMGLTSPVGEIVTWFSENPNKPNSYTVIGVIKDMVKGSPYEAAPPVVMFLNNEDLKWLYIRINPNVSASEALPKIENVISKIVPSSPFDYHFVDDQYNAKFQEEDRIGRLALFFTLMAIVISCLGLLGFAAFLTEKRTKEIGVRRVNGAKVHEILTMLNKDLVKWVAIAFVISCPIAWYTMHLWLENFAYKTELSWWIFALAGLLALGIALLTVSWQSWKAATRNPVEALRYE